MEELIEKLKGQIIEQLNLVDVNPEEVGPEDPLFGVVHRPPRNPGESVGGHVSN